MRRSVSILEAETNSHPEDLVGVLQGLGISYYHQRLYTKAEEAYRNALDVRMKMPTAGRYSVVTLLSNLAAIYQIGRRYGEARVMLERAQDRPDPGIRADHVFRAALLANLAAMARNEGR